MAKRVIRQYDDSEGPKSTDIPVTVYRIRADGSLVVDAEETQLSARIVGARAADTKEAYQTPQQQKAMRKALKESRPKDIGTVPEHAGKTTESVGRPRSYVELATTVNTALFRYT